ncbi:MAG: Response regulator receiver domain [Blastocatellia bacterium]
MINGNAAGPLVLVVEDVEETRDAIEELLKVDGYRVDPARNEEDAVSRGRREPPNIILVSLGGLDEEVIATALRIRAHAELSESTPVVIFCIESVDQGAEVEIQNNVYLTRPDNFDQLRSLLGRVLHRLPPE